MRRPLKRPMRDLRHGILTGMDVDDERCLAEAKQNPSTFEALYKKHASAIFNYFWYRTGHDRSLSEDLMQEVFLRAFVHLPTYTPKGYPYITYLYKIAHNLLVDHYRKHKTVPLEEVVGEVAPFEITEELLHKSDAEALWRAIQELPARSRDVLLMKYREGMSVHDIALVLQTTENAVKLLLSRTRKKLAAHPYLSDIKGFGVKKRRYTKPKFLHTA